MGGGSAPKADPNIGIAALKSAEIGEKYLGWMQDQAKITNQWAAEDRSRWTDVFKPLQDSYIADAQSWDSPARRDAAARDAATDVRLQGRIADGTRVRQAMAMGINPNSGRAQSAAAKAGLDQSLAVVGAQNLARDKIEAQGDAKMANAINLGSGLGINPGTSMSLSNGAISAGAQGAMGGYGQQGQLLNTQYQQQMQAHQAQQSGMDGLLGGLGAVAGMFMPSSKTFKKDRKPVKDGASLEAVRKLPVEEWTYRPGHGDEDRHIGTFAEDFQKATGQGDGKSIDVVSAIGITMGAIKDLDRRLRASKPESTAVAA